MARAPLVRQAVRSTAGDYRWIGGVLGHWASTSGRAPLRRLRAYLLLSAQAGLASALAWTVSHELLHTSEPVFAPAAAVATIAASVGRRLRRTVELVIGVTIGVAVGDLLIALIGTGPWQTGVTVSMAILVASVLRGGSSMITQAGGTAVLIASLSPMTEELEVPRFVNAVTGGAIGLIVVLVLLPLNPLRLIVRRAEPMVDQLARQFAATAQALRDRRSEQAHEALRELPGNNRLGELREAVQAAREVVTYSPLRWRRKNTLTRYEEGLDHLERVFRDSRGLIRRLATLIDDREPVPDALPAAVDKFGEALRLLHREIVDGRAPESAYSLALSVVREAGRAQRAGLGFHGSAAVAQLRTLVHDLLRAGGLDRAEARSLVRRAFAD